MNFPKDNQSEALAVKDGFNVPVALFNFHRPQKTRQVFEAARQIKSRRLLLVADGPRSSRPDDVQLPVVLARRRGGDPARLVADSALARAVLGWEPQYTNLYQIVTHAYRWEQKLRVDLR